MERGFASVGLGGGSPVRIKPHLPRPDTVGTKRRLISIRICVLRLDLDAISILRTQYIRRRPTSSEAHRGPCVRPSVGEACVNLIFLNVATMLKIFRQCRFPTKKGEIGTADDGVFGQEW